MIRAALLCMCLLAAPVRAATVVVSVAGVRNAAGHVRVALCTKADFLRPHCPWKAIAPSVPGTVRISIFDVPPGVYAAQAFHDENDNGRLDRNILGLPKEAMGFSHDAPMRMGPPRFDAAAFSVGEKDERITLTLRYY